MKVLSLIEPWATLIKEGKKLIETRSWYTSYRGELYIHASSKKIKKNDAHTIELLELIPNIPMGYGHILCKCKLVDCVYMDEEFLNHIRKDKQEFLCGEYSLGRYAWILEDVEPLQEPIPAKGHLNIWNYEPENKMKGANTMKIVLLKDSEKLEEGLRSLTEEFIGEYPYYATWILKNEETFKNGTRVVYELREDGRTAGYMMIHFSTAKCAKINGIYVFPNCQKRGYAKQALVQVLEELKDKGYEYAYIQTRIHNKIVVHMFESLHFDVIGKNYHSIEKQDNWVAVYDLKQKRDFAEMNELAEQLYPGFKAI